MKIKKIFSAILLFSFLMGAVGVQKTRALGTPQIIGINPSSPAQVGACISIRARVDWDSEFRSMRIRFGNEGWQESSEIEFERNFCTNNYSTGWYVIRVEVAGQGDNSWSNPRVAEVQYELTGQPEPSKGPSINQFNFSPSDGATVGDSVNIHIKVGSNNPGATTLTVDCGGLSKNETSEVEFDSNWNTSGCPAETVSVLVCARAVDDPNWTNATCATRSYTLSSPQIAVPAPTAQLWSDSKQLSNGQCTYLHWQTTNADRVNIDGNTVQNSGDQQVCPTVTKKYTLSATNQSGTANRNLTIIVSSQPPSQNVADNFQTGNVISIGYDIFVIVNGERRLVPNPETLDALGISRDWIDNKGFGDSDLKTIPLGQDIPDVNRDPAGFAAFKNKYFPNTTPIVPGVEQPVPNQPQEPKNPSNGQWQVGARVGLCAGAQIRSGSGFSYPYYTIVPENNWQVDIIGGPRNNGGVTWWDVSRKNIDGGGTGWIYFEQAGAGNCGAVLGESTESNGQENNNPPEEQTQPEVVQPEATQPPSSDCGWFASCVQAAETPAQPRICEPTASCSWYDLICWANNAIISWKNSGCVNELPPPSPTLMPDEQAAPNHEPSRVWRVVLDPGHGWGGVSGAVGNGLQEKNVNLDIALRTQAILINNGYEVGLTRTGDDYNHSIEYVKVFANDFNADIVVSIHTNSIVGNATGTEAWYTAGKETDVQSKFLAQLLTDAVATNLSLKNRGVFPENKNRLGGLYIHYMKVPSALIETAFISNPNDAELLKNRSQDFAQAIAEAIMAYFQSLE